MDSYTVTTLHNFNQVLKSVIVKADTPLGALLSAYPTLFSRKARIFEAVRDDGERALVCDHPVAKRLFNTRDSHF